MFVTLSGAFVCKFLKLATTISKKKKKKMTESLVFLLPTKIV